ncbi:regulator of (H+)-ATPase in vacuolar membrane, partial [Cryomyces antarcticus]
MAVEVARCRYRLEGKPLCLILVPEAEAHHDSAYVATIGSNGKGIAWTVKLPSNTKQRQPGISDRSQKFDIEEFCTFDINPGDNLAFILPVDPAGSAPVISGFLDPFARDVAISYTKSGTVKSWTARVSREEAKIEWLLTSTIETGLNNLFLASGTSIRKAALVDSAKTTLTIWDTKSAQLEYEERFDGQGIIQDLDWASTPDNQSILAVGFPHRVLIYAQLRYDYLNAGPSWASIREIDIGHLTPHPIGASVWLGNGDLVIGAGNQLFTQDKTVEVGERLVPDIRVGKSQKEKIDLFKIVQRLNGPLPVFHPQFLAQCILAGKLMLAQRILLEFFKVLKFYTEGDHLDPLLGIPLEDFTNDQETSYNHSRKEVQSSYADFTDTEDPASVTEEVATSLNELLMQKQVPQLSSQEQFHLADIIECVGT